MVVILQTDFSEGDILTAGVITSTSSVNGITTNINASTILFYGNGSDGAFSEEAAATTNLNGSQVYQYSSFLLGVAHTLSKVAVDGKPLIIKVQGNCTIDGTIDLVGKGYVGGITNTQGLAYMVVNNRGGAGHTQTTGMAGSPPTANNNPGAGGAGISGDGANGGTGAFGGDAGFTEMVRSYNPFSIFCGAGGSGNQAAEALAGGAGGGSILIIVGGNLIFGGSSSITVAGEAGENSSGAGYGGGGGGAGLIKILYIGSKTDSGLTATITGGAGGTGSGGNGGAGGTGLEIIEQI